MLGRSRMSIRDCIQIYEKLGEDIFGDRSRWDREFKFSAERLGDAIKRVVRERTGDEDTLLLDPEAYRCRVSVQHFLPYHFICLSIYSKLMPG